MLTYQEALDYLYSFVDYGQLRTYRYSPQTFDLTRMVRLLAELGDPQTTYPIVHLAGTKGKGSVSAMCASVLTAAGYRTGFYTSPHLQDFCERIQVDGQRIPPAAVAELVEQMRPVVEAVPGLTTFELITALAFQYFARQSVDLAVIEVGLGGRLDATNVVTPLVSVITSLSYDHTNLLGNTLAEIAGEKGGIIKPGVPVVSAPQKEAAMRVLEKLAAERGAPLTVVGRDWHYRPLEHSLEHQTLEVWPADGSAPAPALLVIPLLGRHQAENAAVAYATLQVLRRQGLALPPQTIRDGLRRVLWPGRFEILGRRPFLVVDGAHNADSARKLRQALQDYFPGRNVVLIFGASSDKDVTGMLAELLPRVSRVLMTQAVHPRAMEPEALAALAAPYGLPLETAAPVAAALERALESAGPEDVVLACGSLFVVAEARQARAARLKVMD